MFDPDRFLDERLKIYLTPKPFIFLPFNAGPRICLGQQVCARRWFCLDLDLKPVPDISSPTTKCLSFSSDCYRNSLHSSITLSFALRSLRHRKNGRMRPGERESIIFSPRWRLPCTLGWALASCDMFSVLMTSSLLIYRVAYGSRHMKQRHLDTLLSDCLEASLLCQPWALNDLTYVSHSLNSASY